MKTTLGKLLRKNLITLGNSLENLWKIAEEFEEGFEEEFVVVAFDGQYNNSNILYNGP